MHTAFAVEADARAASADDFGSWADWERRFSQECSFIAVLYSDAEVEVVHNNFNEGHRRQRGLRRSRVRPAAAADEKPAGPGKAQVQCEVA